MNTWIVTPPHAKEDCYRYTVHRRGGEKVSAYLTYRLTGEGAPSRDLLLVKRDEKNRLPRFLEEGDRIRLDVIERELRGLRPTKGSQIAQKSVVNAVYEGKAAFPNQGVAVHKLGPVPVYILADFLPIQVWDSGEEPRPVEAVIGVYQDTDISGDNNEVWPKCILNRHQFLNSLEPDLPTTMRRYFEDVSEYLFDVQHHLSYREAVERCAEARTTVSRSIRTKLKVIEHPEDYEAGQPAAAEFARHLTAEYGATLRLANSYSYFALLLINSLYRQFHLKDRSDDYLDRLSELQASFDPHESDGSPELTILWQGIDLFLDRRDLTPLLDSYQGSAWLTRMLSFARFIALLEEEGFAVSRPTVFFSGQHHVPTNETVYRLIKGSRLEDIAPLREVFEEDSNTRFMPLIESRIWQSASVAANIPRDRTAIGTTKTKGLAWIIREVDYGDALGKKILPLIEEDQRITDIVDEMRREKAPVLVRGTRRKPKRENTEDALVHHLNEYPAVLYAQKSARSMDANLERRLEKELRWILDERVEEFINVVIGYVAADRVERQAIRKVHRLLTDRTKLSRAKLEHGLMIEALAPHVFNGSGPEVKAKFQNLRARIKERVVTIDGKDYEIIEKKEGTRRYRSNFYAIVGVLRPDLGADDVRSLVDYVFGVQKKHRLAAA